MPLDRPPAFAAKRAGGTEVAKPAASRQTPPSMRGGAIALVAEGADWLVVSKPPHLLVHPTRPGGPVTLLDLLRELLACELAGGGQVSLIHRLDRETSGLMLIAKTAAAARRFSLELMRGGFRKEYRALVRGWPEWDRRAVDAPLLRQGARQPTRIWLKQMIHPEGAPARTDFSVLRRFTRGGEWFSLVSAVPATGRMHQIRVHLASLGYPIVGDKIYGPDEGAYLRFIETGWTPELARLLLLDRHALHAHALSVPGLSSLSGGGAEGGREGRKDGGGNAHGGGGPAAFVAPAAADLARFMEEGP